VCENENFAKNDNVLETKMLIKILHNFLWKFRDNLLFFAFRENEKIRFCFNPTCAVAAIVIASAARAVAAPAAVVASVTAAAVEIQGLSAIRIYSTC
jgi:hypothetical protein